MRRPMLLVTGLLTGLALLTGCDSTVGTQQHLGDTVRLGVNVEQSGDLASYGDSMTKGIQVAVDQANSSGGVRGRQIQLITMDNQGNSGKAVATATTLMSQQRALSVIGPVSDGLFALTLPVADHQQIPVISGSACDANRLNDENGKVYQFGFRTCLGLDQQGAAMATFAHSNLAASTAAVFRTADTGFANEFADAFTDAFTADGGTVSVQDAFPAGETDYSRFVDIMRSSPTDVVYVAAQAPEAASLIRTLREAGIDNPILASGDMNAPAANEIAGPDALNRVYFVSQFSALDTDNAVAQNFLNAYRQAYGADPDTHAAMAYDAILLAIYGIDRADELTGINVQRALATARNIDGAGGKFSIGQGHQVVKDALVVELADGAPVSVTHVAP